MNASLGSFRRRLAQWIAPPAPPVRPRPRPGSLANGAPAAGPGNLIQGGVPWGYFEALRFSDDRSAIPFQWSANSSAVAGIGWNRTLLGNLARYLYDNYPSVSYAVNQIGNYCTPVKPQATTPDNAYNSQLEDIFEAWTKVADYNRRPLMTFYGLQEISSQGMDMDGDVGWLMEEDEGQPRLRVIPGPQISSAPVIPSGDTPSMDGVVLDAQDRVTGYRIVTNADAGLAVPAAQMALLFEPSAAWPFRGVSPLRRGMNDIRDLQDIKGFTKLGVKWQQALVAALKSNPLETDLWGDDSGDDKPDDTDTQQRKKMTLAQMFGGDIPVLDAGQELTTIPGDRPTNNVLEFMETLAGFFCSGLDIPPAFFLDTKLTGPNTRSVNGKAQRKFNKRQSVIGAATQWAWVRIIGAAIARGEVEARPGWDIVRLQRPQRITIDLGDEANADRDDVEARLKTRQEAFGKRALDWETETDQCLNEDAYIIRGAKRIAVQEGVPLELVLARYDMAPPAPGTEPPVNPNK